MFNDDPYLLIISFTTIMVFSFVRNSLKM